MAPAFAWSVLTVKDTRTSKWQRHRIKDTTATIATNTNICCSMQSQDCAKKIMIFHTKNHQIISPYFTTLLYHIILPPILSSILILYFPLLSFFLFPPIHNPFILRLYFPQDVQKKLKLCECFRWNSCTCEMTLIPTIRPGTVSPHLSWWTSYTDCMFADSSKMSSSWLLFLRTSAR